MNQPIGERVSNIRDQIAAAARRAGRDPSEVTLLAATKGQPFEALCEYVEFERTSGRKALLGESYVQPLREKRARLAGHPELAGSVDWYLMGALQRNKAKDAVLAADCILAVHNDRIAHELDRRAAALNVNKPIYLEVNISEDPNKAGFLPKETAAAATLIRTACPALRLVGLMTITAWYDDPEEARPDFRRLAQLRHDIAEGSGKAEGAPPLQLSMGMSHDFEIAIEEGATQVRIGTAIFGERSV